MPFALRYLCTLSVNQDVVHPNSRESFIAAARRWGAQYVEIVSTSDLHEHHYIQKLTIEKWFPDNARVCYFDADTIIRSDCPNLFELVPEWELGLVRSWQPGHHCGNQGVIASWCERHGLPSPQLDTDYHNGGLIVFSNKYHRECLRYAVTKMMEAPWECINHWEIGDQAPLSASVKAMQIPVRWLAPAFNRCGALLWNGWTPSMTDFVWHFCGPMSKEIACRFTAWQEHGPDRYTKSGRTRWQVGSPLMLSDGKAEVPFLHQTLRFLPQNAVVVEVGSWLGGSLFHILKGTEDLGATIHCVDHWQGDPDLNPAGGHVDDIFQGFLTNLRELGSPENIVIHQMPSIEAANEFTDNSVDMIYLDGSHDYSSVLNDLTAWWPKLKDGAIVSGHDYTAIHFPGLVKAVDEFFGTESLELSFGGWPIWRLRKCGSNPRKSERLVIAPGI